jgi:hypothetical protein
MDPAANLIYELADHDHVYKDDIDFPPNAGSGYHITGALRKPRGDRINGSD